MYEKRLPFLLSVVLFAPPTSQAQEFYSAPYYCTVNPGNTTVSVSGGNLAFSVSNGLSSG